MVSAAQFGVGRGEIGVDVWSSCYSQLGRSSDYEAHSAWYRDYLRKSYTVSAELSRAYLLAASRTTLSNLIIRHTTRRQFHTLRKFGHCVQSVVAMGYESAWST